MVTKLGMPFQHKKKRIAAFTVILLVLCCYGAGALFSVVVCFIVFPRGHKPHVFLRLCKGCYQICAVLT